MNNLILLDELIEENKIKDKRIAELEAENEQLSLKIKCQSNCKGLMDNLTNAEHQNNMLRQKLSMANETISELESALKEIINHPCQLDDIDKKELLRDIKNPCKELCKIRENCPGKIVKKST